MYLPIRGSQISLDLISPDTSLALIGFDTFIFAFENQSNGDQTSAERSKLG